MAGSPSVRALLEFECPQTYAALQRLVMSMADAANNYGKRSIFGKDKGAAAFEKYLVQLASTVRAMSDDRLFMPTDDSGVVRERLVQKIELFAMGYPNWKDAYGFAVAMLVHHQESAVREIDKIRRDIADADYAYDHPLPNRLPRT